tara:strand:+ start:534 stop:1022 length:489 start_codon:yes stop_codon:yes gene_type:complete
VPTQLHAVQVDHKQPTCPIAKLIALVSWLQQKMAQVKISVIGSAFMQLSGRLRKTLNQPAFKAYISSTPGWVMFPGAAKFLQTLSVTNFIRNDERLTVSRVATFVTIASDAERIDSQALQVVGTVPFIHRAYYGQAEVDQILDDFLPAYPGVGLEEITLVLA